MAGRPRQPPAAAGRGRRVRVGRSGADRVGRGRRDARAPELLVDRGRRAGEPGRAPNPRARPRHPLAHRRDAAARRARPGRCAPPGSRGFGLRTGARGLVSGPEGENRAGAVFGALSDPTRRALLAAIAEHSATTATELASEMPISRQAVLKHLNALAAAGLIARQRSGREVRYEFTPAPLSDAVDWMTAVGAEWDERLGVLRRQLGAGDSATSAGSRDTARPTPRSAGKPAPPPTRRRSIPGA